MSEEEKKKYKTKALTKKKASKPKKRRTTKKKSVKQYPTKKGFPISKRTEKNMLLVAQYLVSWEYVDKFKNMQEVADAVGINRCTIYEWLNHDDFQAVMAEIQKNEVGKWRALVHKSFTKKTIEKADAERVKLWMSRFEGWVGIEKREKEVLKETIEFRRVKKADMDKMREKAEKDVKN